MKKSGFTIVETIIVITVIGILMILGVVNLNQAQINARDTERKTDIKTIAYFLEDFYLYGSDAIQSSGQYPSVDTTNGLIGRETTYFRDFIVTSISAPNIKTSSLIAATNNIQTIDGILPKPTVSQYIYQPIATDGSLCNSLTTKECRKFNLYYRLEIDNTVQMVTSKNQ